MVDMGNFGKEKDMKSEKLEPRSLKECWRVAKNFEPDTIALVIAAAFISIGSYLIYDGLMFPPPVCC